VGAYEPTGIVFRIAKSGRDPKTVEQTVPAGGYKTFEAT
jgi:hypothetical protein